MFLPTTERCIEFSINANFLGRDFRGSLRTNALKI